MAKNIPKRTVLEVEALGQPPSLSGYVAEVGPGEFYRECSRSIQVGQSSQTVPPLHRRARNQASPQGDSWVK